MPREENVPVRQQEEFGFDQPKLAGVYRPSDKSLIGQQIKLMKSHLEEQEKMLDKFRDGIMGLFDQLAVRPEQDARQPRLAIEADGPANTKTRECTEGAATAVQAMHGDSCSTAQKVQDGPKTSISFGVMAEPPDLPCREDVLVEDGATSPESCLPSLEMRSSTAAGGLVSTGETSTATETTVNKPLLQSYSSEEENSKKKKLRTSTPTSRTTAVPVRRVPCLLLPTAGGSLRQNPGKIGRLIQAVRKVIPASARFWDRGARWFVVRLCVLEQPGDELQRFSE